MREAASFIAGQGRFAQPGVVPALVQSVTAAVHAWVNRRKVARLYDFDDHMLADVGLSRRDVQKALDLPFGYDPSRELQRVVARRQPRGWQE
jgi:uncharacterized protein YjiS (DUF1127 family)